MITAWHVAHSLVECMHYIQTWPRSVPSGLVIPEQPYRKQIPGSTGMNINENAISTLVNVYTSIKDIHAENPRGYKPSKAKIVHNTRLATQKR